MVRINSSWVKFFHVIYLVAWGVTDLTKGYLYENYKYLFWAVPIGLAALIFWENGCKIKKETLVFREHLIYCLFFIAVSVVAIFVNEHLVFDLRDVMRMIFALIYGFLLLNTDDTENKDFYVDTLFIACIVVLIFRFRSEFSIAQLLTIDFLDSYSPFEHHLAHEFAFYFFYYYRRKKTGRVLLSVLLSYVTLKRIHILAIVLILVLGPFLKKIKVTNGLINFAKVCFFLSPVLMDFLVSPIFVNWFDSTFEVSFYQFTMSRVNQMDLLLNYEGSLLGLQGVDQFLRSNKKGVILCHSDIIRLYLETTIVGLALYVNAFFNMLKQNRDIYAFAAMLLMFVSMFASVNLQRPHTYLMIYLICCIDFEAAAREDELSLLNRESRKRFSSFSLRRGVSAH